MLPVALLVLGGAAVAVAVAASAKPAGPPKLPAAVRRIPWRGPPDEAHASLYPPVHLFAPNGLDIVERAREHPAPDNYVLTEYDSAGNIWQAIRMYDPSTMGYPLRPESDDTLTPFSGDFHGYSDWRQAIGTYLEIAQAIISFVPGVGAGVNFAISAGVALAEGKSLSDAVVAGVRASVPGGPLAVAAFDAAMAAAKGKSLSQIALAAARSALPSDLARQAFDVGIAVAKGQSIQRAAYDAVARSYIPAGNIREFADRIARGEPVAQAALAVGGPAAKAAALRELDKATSGAASPLLKGA